MVTPRMAAVNDRGIDYSGARPSPVASKKAGAGFIVRYSAGVGNSQPATQWKLCGTGEIAAAVAAGMDFLANSEWYESRITEGAAAGRADGAADLVFWKSRGLAKGASIFVSWDQAPVRAKWAAVDAYLRGYQSALGGYYRVDCYAGTPYLKHALSLGLIRYGWRPNAGSWSGDGLPYQPRITAAVIAQALKATPAALWQTGNYWWNKGADENVLLRPAGTHLAAVAAAAKPKPPVTPAKPPVKPTPPAPSTPVARPAGAPNSLYSLDGHHRAVMQNDGNFVIYHDGKPIWASNTYHK